MALSTPQEIVDGLAILVQIDPDAEISTDRDSLDAPVILCTGLEPSQMEEEPLDKLYELGWYFSTAERRWYHYK